MSHASETPPVGSTQNMAQLALRAQYTTFHLGVYMTLLVVIVAFLTSELAPPRSSLSFRLFVATVIFLLLAAICGSVAGSNIPNFAGLTDFNSRNIRLAYLPFLQLSGSAWVRAGHGCFWIAIAFMLFGMTRALNQDSDSRERRTLAAQQEVADLFATYSDAWNVSDLSTVAALWERFGEWTNHNGETVRGRDNVYDRLSQNSRGAQFPLAFTERHVRYTDSVHAVVSGQADFNVLDENSQIQRATDRFVAFLAKSERGWTIHAWVWTTAHPPTASW